MRNGASLRNRQLGGSSASTAVLVVDRRDELPLLAAQSGLRRYRTTAAVLSLLVQYWKDNSVSENAPLTAGLERIAGQRQEPVRDSR